MANLNNFSEEIWLPVLGYEGLYEVSNLARIRSLVRVNNQRKVTLRAEPLIRKSNPNADGYLELSMCNNGVEKKLSVHRLVAIAFVPNPDNLPEVNHEDGNKLNNLPYNLKWVNRSGNVKHAFDNNLKKPKYGSGNPLSKITEEQAAMLFNSNLTATELSKIYNIPRGIIYDVKSGATWNHITGKTLNASKRLSRDVVIKIFNHDGMYETLDSSIKVNKGTYYDIKKGAAYSHITGKIFNHGDRKKRVELKPRKKRTKR